VDRFQGLLAGSIDSAEVNELLAAGSRQTMHDHPNAGTLLGILDRWKRGFPSGSSTPMLPTV